MITRLTDSVETALRVGDGYLTVHNMSSEPPEDRMFSENLACPEHGSILIEIEPRTFSFNTPPMALVRPARDWVSRGY